MKELKIGTATVNATLTQEDVAIVQEKTPVVTGNLQRGFHVDEEGNISDEVEYAGIVELGTSKFSGRFMATKSVPEIGKDLCNRIRDQLNSQAIIKLPVIKV